MSLTLLGAGPSGSSSAPAPTILLDLPLHNSGSCFSDNGVTPAGDGDTVYLWQQSIDGVDDFEQTTADSRPYYRTGGIETNGDQRYMTLAGGPNLPALGTEIVFYAYVDVPAFGGLDNIVLGSSSLSSHEFRTNSNNVMLRCGDNELYYGSTSPGTGVKLFRVRVRADGTGRVTWTGAGSEYDMVGAFTDPTTAAFDSLLATIEEGEGPFVFFSPDAFLIRAVRAAAAMNAAGMAAYETATSGASLVAPS